MLLYLCPAGLTDDEFRRPIRTDAGLVESKRRCTCIGSYRPCISCRYRNVAGEARSNSDWTIRTAKDVGYFRWLARASFPICKFPPQFPG